MPTLQSVAKIIEKYPVFLFLALVGAGLAGNYYNCSLFLASDYLFGSIFAMLALQFFGLGRGILAAAMIASSTYMLWDHPFAIIIMTAEVAVVGWRLGRRKRGLVEADILYWLVAGMPLAYLFYHGVMHLSASNTYMIMIKQAVNGITNALIAHLIFTAYTLRTRSSLTSSRDIIFNLMAFFVLCPALITLAITSRDDFNEVDRDIRATLTYESRQLSHLITTWTLNRRTSIINLAELAASKSIQEMQSSIEQARKSDLNYLRIGLADKHAISVAFSPLRDEKGTSTIGISFAERPYVSVLQQTLKPMFSEVIMGKVGIIKPRALMLAPVVAGGEYNGYVFGVLDFDQLRDYLDESSKHHGLLYTLLDKNGNVLMTNRADQTIMTPFVRGKGTLESLDGQLRQWIPEVPPRTPVSERWRNSYYVAETTTGETAEWKLVFEQPVAPFQKKLYDSYTKKLSLRFLILLAALALAGILSRRFHVTLEQLRLVTHDLPDRLKTHGQDVVWPESGAMEIQHLIDNFKEMSASLLAQFQEVQQANKLLEQRVRQRTAELSESEERYRSILNASPVPMALNDERQCITFLNPAFVQTFGYTREDIPTLAHWWPQAYPDPACRQEAAAAWQARLEAAKRMGAAFAPEEVTVRCKDLTNKTVLINTTSLANAAQGEHLAIFYDITDRKQVEAALRESEEKYRIVFENETMANYIFDLEMLKIIDVNDTAVRLYGYGREEFLNELSVLDLSGEPETTKEAIVLARSQKAFFIPLRFHRKKDGTSFPVEIVGETFLHKGRLVMLSMVKDIGERLQIEKKLQTSLAEKEVLLREVHHRVKNNMAAILGLIDLQRQAMNERQTSETTLTDLSARVRAMSLVHEKLYHSDSLSQVDVQDYIQSLVSHLRTSFGSPHIRCEIEAQGMGMPLDLAVPCGMIINELVINALKYAFPRASSDDRIIVSMGHDRDTFTLTVADNGVGLPAGFDFNSATTLGLSLVRMLGQHQLGGRYQIDQSAGTRFTLTFSLHVGRKTYA